MREDGALLVRLRDPTVEVPPGGRATVRAEVANTGDDPVRAHVRVTGRAARWLSPADGADVLEVPAGGTRTVTLVAQPPRAGLRDDVVPFALHVDAPGARAGATGLLVLVHGGRVEVELEPRSVTARRTARFVARVRGDGGPGVVGLRPAGTGRARLWLSAPTTALGPDDTTTVDVTARAPRPALLAPVRHDVLVAWELHGDPDVRGTARAVLVQRPVLPVPLTALVLLLLLAGVVVGTRVLLGRDPLPFGAPGAAPPAASAAPADGVSGAWVQLGAVPQGADPAASRASAGARAEALVGAGVPRVRVVDGAALPGATPGTAAFWVLVVDGFPDAGAADGFCQEHADALGGARCVPSG